mgnify:CR=1 FL=1
MRHDAEAEGKLAPIYEAVRHAFTNPVSDTPTILRLDVQGSDFSLFLLSGQPDRSERPGRCPIVAFVVFEDEKAGVAACEELGFPAIRYPSPGVCCVGLHQPDPLPLLMVLGRICTIHERIPPGGESLLVPYFGERLVLGASYTP